VGTLSDTVEAIGRIQDVAPAVVPTVFNHGTRMTGRWANTSYEGYVPAMNDHVLVAILSGHGSSSWKTGAKPLVAPLRRGGITVAPRGYDGLWRAESCGSVVSTVFLSHERLLECAEQLSDGRPIELVGRLNVADSKLFTIMELISEEVALGPASSRLFIEQLLDLVCTQLLRAHSAFSLPAAVRYHGLVPWQIKRVTSYMRQNLDQDIGLQELADLVSLSRFYFCSAFRMATGYTPHEWLTRLRMHEARRLLADPSLPISAIALTVGYQTPSAFSATFRRLVGATPREFRRSLHVTARTR
jgi:AraC family transcriptional regulator